MMNGALMELPADHGINDNVEVSLEGAPELQMGTLMWTRPMNFSFSFSTWALRVLMSLT